MLRRRRFGGLISRQLDLFLQDHAALLAQCKEAEAAYDRADRDEAEERYGDYQDLVETGTEILAQLRDNFAATLEETDAEEYERLFNQSVHKRLPRFALEIDTS